MQANETCSNGKRSCCCYAHCTLLATEDTRAKQNRATHTAQGPPHFGASLMSTGQDQTAGPAAPPAKQLSAVSPSPHCHRTTHCRTQSNVASHHSISFPPTLKFEIRVSGLGLSDLPPFKITREPFLCETVDAPAKRAHAINACYAASAPSPVLPAAQRT